MGWTMPLQQASYRGVRFDVINVVDNFERALAEHSYPFVNGADLEDMGLQPRRVQMQAVFFGEGYQIPLNKFITTLYEQGADVLVHPVFGRMPNMICQSASLRHGDEFVDYVALDLTFVEMTEAKPIFVFEHSLWGEIDKLLNQLESFVDGVLGLYSEFMKEVAQLGYAKSRLLKAWSGLAAIYESLVLMFGSDNKYRISAGINQANFVPNATQAMKEINAVIAHGLMQIVAPQNGQRSKTKAESINALFSQTLFAENEEQDDVFAVLTAKANFDEVLRQVKTLKQLPMDLVLGKNDSAKRAAKLNALISGFKWEDMQETACAIDLMTTAVLTRIGVQLIESYAERLLPNEIEYIARQVRLSIATSLEGVRLLQKQDVTPMIGEGGKPNTGIYTQSAQIIEQMRDLAHGVSQLAITAINRKPPLMVKHARVNGTIHQVAHDFYGDYRRADELLRLNPQISQPNFIVQGDLINAYAK